MTTALVVLALVVLGLVAVVLLVRRERRAAALAARLDAADAETGLREHADATRQQEGHRGQAGGLSMGGADHNSAGM